MSIQSGQILAHYRLIDKIGEGGMGVVWKASDTSLNRDVAIKVLPAALAGDADRMARFEREARLLASLNHPNIAAVYGLHEAETPTGPVRFIAMELVPGEELSARIAAGPLPLDEALEIVGQIADALACAHDSGVVHRDLKPANVVLTADGKAKVLDFGLAKAVEAGPLSGDSVTLSPTMTSAGTAAGVLLGTAAYMSPEQARGKPVDRQTDVWAFGCILFELLTGRPAYSGETVTDVLTAILHRDPEWDSLPPLPPGVERVLRGCLRKDRRERLRDAGDAGLRLREAAAVPAGGGDAGSGVAPARRGARLWPVLAVASTLALIAVLIAGRMDLIGSNDRTGSVRIVAIAQLTDLPGEQASPSLSGDAEQLLFVTEDGGDTDIFLQRVGGENPVNLTADYPDDDFQPAFSPDRKSIAFASRREGGGIFVMGATGESPRQVSDAGFDPAWSPDGTRIVYTTERIGDPYRRLGPAQLWVLDLDTLERRQLGQIDAAGAAWSPNDRRIAFWTHAATVQGQRDIWTMAPDGTDPQAIVEDLATDWDPFWSPDGTWLYFISDRDGLPNLWRVPVHEATGRPRGPLEPVTSGISSVAEAGISADGRRVVVNSRRSTGEILMADFDPLAERLAGRPRTLLTSSNAFRQLDLSADGAWIVYRTSKPTEALFVMRTDGSARRKILDDEYRNRGPHWSPDGRWILFYSNRDGTYQAWAIRPNGTDLRQLTAEREDINQPRWLPDGKRFLSQAAGSAVLFELGPDGVDGVTEPLEAKRLPAAYSVITAAVSPDGRYLAGGALDTQGELAVTVTVIGTTEGEQPLRDDGRLFRMRLNNAAWLDSRRFAFWDAELDSAVIWDVDRKESRLVPDIPGPAELQFSGDGRKVILTRQPIESDIWMLTLADG